MFMKNFWLIVILGIVLRIFLSFATFHPDTVAFDLGGKTVASGNILNLYDFSSKDAIFNYPPLIYWFHGIFHLLLPFSSYGFVKLPYLLIDVLVIFVLLKLFKEQNKARLAVIIWTFNPINLYATYMMGQFDIIPTFFTLLSLYFISKDRLNLAALSLGGGIAFKLYPIFLVIPLLILGKTVWDKSKLIILALLPYIISILPYIGSGTFRTTALFAAQSSKSLYASIPISGGESILLFPGALIIFYLFLWKRKFDMSSVWKIYLIPLLLFFIFTHFHPQWIIWITPFIIIDLVSNGFKNILPFRVIFLSWFMSLFFFDSSLTIGMFNPLFPILKNASDIWTIFHLTVDYNMGRSILQTALAGAMIYLIYEYIYKRENA